MLGSSIILVLLFALVAYLTYRLIRDNPFARANSSGGILIDTSVLIDGRIMPIAKSGFITDLMVIPRSVIRELQFLADNSDSEKRARARHGLDVVKDLQALDTVHVEILPDDNAKHRDGVDEHLLRLAKESGASICTIDFNLIKVAEIEDVHILNINELAQNLRIAHLPGETITIELKQKGQDAHQGVGYLDDGTMVVVENGNSEIGKTVSIEVDRSIQTVAGKMLFAKLVNTKPKKKNKVVTKLSKVKPSGRSPKKQTTANQPKNNSSQKQRKSTQSNKSNSRKKSTPKKASPRNRTAQQREDSLVDLINNQ